jgi:ATP-dependent Clp protease ATP-binding subunit ClpA
MFERFTTDARGVVVRAQSEARELRHSHVGTEHMLLGLVVLGNGPGGQVLTDHGVTPADVRRRILEHLGGSIDPEALATLGIDLDAVRQATEAAFGPGALDDPRHHGRRRTGHIPMTSRAKKVLELSLREALRRGDSSIGTGHVLLGLIREGQGLAPKILTEMGLALPRLREEVERLIEAEAA